MQNTLTIPTIEEIEAAVQRAVEAVLLSKKFQLQTEQDEVGGVGDAAKWIGKAPATIYDLCHRREIPHSKRGKQLYFSKKELLAWIQGGRRKTTAEIATEAEDYQLNAKQKGKR